MCDSQCIMGKFHIVIMWLTPLNFIGPFKSGTEIERVWKKIGATWGLCEILSAEKKSFYVPFR